MADITTTTTVWQGVLLQEPRATLWAAQSSYTEAGPRPGIPEPQAATSAVLESAGVMAAAGYLEVRVQRPGTADLASGRGLAVVWRPATTGDWRGWDPPGVIMGQEPLEWTGGGVEATPEDACTLADGTVLVAAAVKSVTYRVRVYRRHPTTFAWSFVDVYTGDAFTLLESALCVLTDRVILYHWVRDSPTSKGNLRAWSSTDSGATWTLWAPYVLSDDTNLADRTLRRIRAAFDGRNVCIVVWTRLIVGGAVRERLTQYASSTLGASAALIGETVGGAAATHAGYQDLVALPGGGFLMVSLPVGLSQQPRWIAAGSAWDSLVATQGTLLVAVAWGVLNGAGEAFDSGDVALTTTDDGAIFVYSTQASGGRGEVYRSADAGATWVAVGEGGVGSDGGWQYHGATAERPIDLVVTWWRGRVVMAARYATGADALHASVLYLGGYSTVTLPGAALALADTTRIQWEWTYLPWRVPGSVGWTAAGLGTETVVLSELQVTTNLQTRTFSRAPVGTLLSFVALLEVEAVTGGSLTTNDITIQLRLADTFQDRRLRLRFASTGFRVVDDSGPTTVGDVTYAAPGTHQVLIWFGGGTIAVANAVCTVWWRARSMDSDAPWTLGPTSTTLGFVGVPLATHQIQWGHDNIAAGATQSDWRLVMYAYGPNTGAGFTGFVNPDSLFGRTLVGQPVDIDDGTAVVLRSGPGAYADTWKIRPRFDFEIARLDSRVIGSPRVAWRNVVHGVEQTIALVHSTPTGSPSDIGSGAVGLALFGANIRLFELQGWDGAAWVLLASGDLADTTESLRWERGADSVRPSAAATVGDMPWLDSEECVGGTFEFDTGVTRKIAHNTGGAWRAVGRKAQLALSGITGAEPASGTNGRIWMPSGVLLFTLAAADFGAFRLRIPAQTTADGYYQIGTMVLGPVVSWHQRYGWGRVVRTVPGVEVTETSDRIVRTRQLGPIRREWEIDWTDGYDETPTSPAEAPDPDYYAGSPTPGKRALGAVGAGARLLEGTFRLLDGPASPLVYLPRVPSADTAMLTRREQFGLCRVANELRRDVVLGDEAASEHARITALLLREEV